MSALEIVDIVVMAVIVVAVIVWVIIKGIKNKWFSKLYDTLKVAISEAEKAWPTGHGADKKAYVMERIKEECDKLGIPYALIESFIKKMIDTIIEHCNVMKK